MRSTDKVIAIFAADIHLSHKPPVWRSAEPDWYWAMQRPLNEIADLQKIFECPVIYAGDIFDRWNSPPELINFAIKHLPKGYAIPGQHDLPLHNMEDIEKSAYWTLYKAGVLKHISPKCVGTEIGFPKYPNSLIDVHAFPFGFPIQENKRKNNLIQIALVHEYVWIKDASYPNAPKEKKIDYTKNKKGRIKGYDIIVYGDNHKGFWVGFEDAQILNCGTLMRRKSDEVDYQPQIGLLLDSGKMISHKLDISQDQHLESMENVNEDEKIDLSDFIEELELLGDTALDFQEAMKQYFESNKTKKAVKKILLKAMEK